MSKELFEQITQEFISSLEENIIPWKQPWMSGPTNLSTFSEYRGINFWRLSMTAQKNNWPNEWATFNQIKQLDGSIISGSKGTKVYFWKPLKIKGQEGTAELAGTNDKTIPLLKVFTVFNRAQCSGLPESLQTPKIEFNKEGEVAINLINTYCAREYILTDPSNRAAYSPSRDRILMPVVESFTSEAGYLSTYFHEITHSTGHLSRLAREGITETHYFGDETYSKEELIAEMGASFLCAKTGTSSESSVTNSKAYIQGWIKALKDDPKLLMQAASKAQKAVDFIMDGPSSKEVQS